MLFTGTAHNTVHLLTGWNMKFTYELRWRKGKLYLYYSGYRVPQRLQDAGLSWGYGLSNCRSGLCKQIRRISFLIRFSSIRKLLQIALSILFVISLAGCSNNDSITNQPHPSEPMVASQKSAKQMLPQPLLLNPRPAMLPWIMIMVFIDFLTKLRMRRLLK